MTLRRIGMDDIPPPASLGVDPEADAVAARVMDEVRAGGETALARLAAELDGNRGRLWYERADFERALASLPPTERSVLEAAAARIRAFAEAQKAALRPVAIDVPGGRAGHDILPVASAGCYVPGGRYPLPSSALMTALVARVAGVGAVVVACPKPEPAVLAACALAGADLFLRAGGAQAIAALTFGAGPCPSCAVVVGPGNRYVAAAKRLARSYARTDAPAGPSELLVLADDTADPVAVAWDLLAQAEHDERAVPMLAAVSADFADAVERELARALGELERSAPDNARTARAALARGWSCVVTDADALVAVANRACPEHLEIAAADAEAVAARCANAGAVFYGPRGAEVFGDYGAGPNHTLPTGGAARGSGGLSVFDFLRVRTWLALDGPDLARDTAAFARMEGLEAHARSALARASSLRP